MSPETSLPMVTCHLLLDAGSRRDPTGQEGLAYLTAKGLLLGTTTATSTVLHDRLDFMGATLQAMPTKDYVTLSLRVLKKDLDQGLDLFFDVLLNSAFPAEDLHKEIEKTLAAIQSANDQPQEVANKAFEKAVFRTGPYGHPIEGTPEALPMLGTEATKRFHRAYYHPNHAILAVVGDITAAEIQAKLLPRLAAWPMGDMPPMAVEALPAQEPTTIQIDRAVTQATIVLGHGGVRRDNPDYYALSVMNNILGSGGFSSRLMEEIRNQRGLAYGVASTFESGKLPGSFQVVLQTKNASARETIRLTLQELERLQTDMVSEAELDAAKQYLIGSFPLRFDTQGKLASFLTQVAYYGLGLDYPQRYPALITSVTRADVLRVAQTYLHPKQAILVVVAHLKEAALD